MYQTRFCSDTEIFFSSCLVLNIKTEVDQLKMLFSSEETTALIYKLHKNFEPFYRHLFYFEFTAHSFYIRNWKFSKNYVHTAYGSFRNSSVEVLDV